MRCGGNISHVGPVHSITGRGCFPGLYIITHVLFIFLRSMVMQRGWGVGRWCEQDGCHRQVNLSTAEQRQGKNAAPPSHPPTHPPETLPVQRFSLGPFAAAPICCAFLCLEFTPPSQNCRFSLTKRSILCLIEGDKWKVGSRGRMARGFLETTSSSGSGEAAAAGPHRWPRIWIRSAVPSDNRPD